MKAVVEIKGHQYIIEEGTIFDVEKIDITKEKDELNKILLLEDSGKVEIGTPYIKNVTLKVEELETLKGPKLIVFKFKRKTGYKKKQGHRQTYTRLRVNKIEKK